MLGHAANLLGMTDEECKVILKPHSFVDNHPILMRYEFNQLTAAMLSMTRPELCERVQDARRVCYQKLASDRV